VTTFDKTNLPVAVLAHRGGEMRVAAVLITGTSYDEIVGKAWRFVRRIYPANEGWVNHFVQVNDNAQIIDDPEAGIISPVAP